MYHTIYVVQQVRALFQDAGTKTDSDIDGGKWSTKQYKLIALLFLIWLVVSSDRINPAYCLQLHVQAGGGLD